MKRKIKEEKPKYFPVHPKLYPVIKDFHRHWFKECKCEYCREAPQS